MAKTIAESLIEEGIEKGKQEGRREGREEGIVRGEQDALIHVLQSRLGRVSKTVERRIRRIDDLEKLRSLLAQACTADSIKEVEID